MPSSSTRRKSTQRGAYALALLSGAWTPLSLFTFFDWFDSRRTLQDPNAIPYLSLWGIQLLLVGLTMWMVRVEKKREAFWLATDVSEPVDLTIVRKMLTSELRNGLKQLPEPLLGFAFFAVIYLLMGYAMTSQIPDIEPLIAIGALMFVGFLVHLIATAFDSYRVAVRRNRAYEEQRNLQQPSAFSMEQAIERNSQL